MTNRPLEHWNVNAFEESNDRIGANFSFLQPQPERAQHRCNAQRHQHRTNHREGDGVGEWFEQLAFDTLQREHRKKHSDDDENGEEHRPADFLRRNEDGIARGVFPVFLQVPIDILDHHYGCIDHHPDADCQAAERHEIRRQALVPHEDESHEHAKGNCRGGNKGAAKVAQQQHQNDQHQRLAFNQRFNDRVHTVIDELGLIVVVNDRHAGRQRLVDLRYFFLDSLDYLLGVFVDALEDDSGNDFSLPVLGDGTLTDLIADLHSSNVAHTNRRAIARVEHDVSDVGDVFDQTQPPNDVLLVAMLDEVSSGVLIIVLDGFEERFERDVVTDQRLLIDDHLILLDVAAKAEHVRDTRHGA